MRRGFCLSPGMNLQEARKKIISADATRPSLQQTTQWPSSPSALFAAVLSLNHLQSHLRRCPELFVNRLVRPFQSRSLL